MPDEYHSLATGVRTWFEQAQQAGQLDRSTVGAYERLDHATPSDLFTDAESRPLVVAFFGGTGVGKSSLLNRLAGEPIARTGVERPTSREITLYLHQDVGLSAFPTELPLETVQVRRHTNDRRRQIMWVDAPDIDSTEPANRTCALAWLPHIDLLVYVVSPERYRDDVGWRVLQERGRRHGWLFVMNHWDEGDRSQRDDFAHMLRQAGFEDPVVLCTSCRPDAGQPPSDDFAQIEQVIGALLEAHGVRELARLGYRARLQELRTVLQRAVQRLGDDATWQRLIGDLGQHWQQTAQTIEEGLTWPLRAIAGRFAARDRGMLRLLGERLKPALLREDKEPATAAEPVDSSEIHYLTQSVWDEWADAKVVQAVDQAENTVRGAGVVVTHLRRRLDVVAGDAGNLMRTRIEDELRAALASPGTRLQRLGRRVTGFLCAMLPLAALAWVCVNLVRHYYAASTAGNDAAYPGTNFAIGSILLVAVAWALPFWIDRLMRPSMEQTVLRALRSGVEVGLALVGDALVQAARDAAAAAAERRAAGERLLKQLATMLVRPVRTDRAEISRLVAATAENPEGKKAAAARPSDAGSPTP